MSKVWYPYAQMKNAQPHYHVQSAKGVVMTLKNGQELIDGVSSWWASIHGYNHPHINKAIYDQTQDFSHVMLGGLTHDPAQKLAQKLAAITPQGLSHVFFSDSGSVGVEVAVKIAIQYWLNKGIKGKHKMLSLTKAYHGDTFKAMEVGADDDFHITYKGIINRDFIIPAPSTSFHDTTASTIDQDIQHLEEVLQENHHQIAGFILEPIMQCAGGFNMYHPQYLQAARRLCKQYEVLLIFDEVATGFGRTGKLFAANHAEVSPDIMVLGKALTAGYVGHAATVVQQQVFEGFYGDSYEQALMHGPTFMGNALACRIALAGIELIEKENYLDKIANIESILQEELLNHPTVNASHPQIADVRVLGATGVIEVTDAKYLKDFQAFAIEQGVWLRPFLNYLYTMPPYIISDKQLRKLTAVMKAWFE